MTTRPLNVDRGVSLVEALVALGVLAFGILGVVGVQVSLRMNADISKQRAAAVRIAQEAVEARRSFVVLGATANGTGYGDIVTKPALAVSGYSSNTTFTLRESVVDAQAGDPSEPRLRALAVDVTWADRSGTSQVVQLTTHITGIPPGMAGSLGVPGDRSATQLPGGRNPLIPRTAVDQGTGISVFAPPVPTGSPVVSWTFNNTSGVITRICPSPGSCVDTNRLLLSGFVRFVSGPLQATAAQSENPSDPTTSTVPTVWLPLTVAVTVELPVSTPPVTCYSEAFPVYVAYYCAMPVTTSSPARWTGTANIDAPSLIATSTTDTTPSRYRVCRYTPGRGEDANSDGIADGDKPLRGNIDHPRRYETVTTALTNQNFLVIPAGGDVGGVATAFQCPGDDTSTPFITGNTYEHQPHS